MTITANAGPLIIFGQSASGGEYNPSLGASLFYSSAGIMDPRAGFAYQPGINKAYGWLGTGQCMTQDIVPYTATAGAIVASANPTGATLALVSANSTTSGVFITTSFVRSDTGVVDAGPLVALDAYTSTTASFASGVMTVTANTAMPITPGMIVQTAGTVTAGTLGANTIITGQLTAGTGGNGVAGTYSTNNGTLSVNSGTVTLGLPTVDSCALPTGNVRLWNAQALIGRAVAVTAASGATYTTATVSGYDVYGFPTQEAITLTAASQVAGKKAFKYIKSVVLSGGSADTTHAYSVDTTNVFGLPLRSDSFGDLTVNYAAALNLVTGITAATSYLPSDRTVATATTGDVRGTFGAFTSSTGANKLVIRQTPPAYNVGSITGLVGLSQFSF